MRILEERKEYVIFWTKFTGEFLKGKTKYLPPMMYEVALVDLNTGKEIKI